jgi:hypothetical protein
MEEMKTNTEASLSLPSRAAPRKSAALPKKKTGAKFKTLKMCLTINIGKVVKKWEAEKVVHAPHQDPKKKTPI